MKLTDIKPLEFWIALQEEVNDKFNLNADVMDNEGKRLSGNTWGNDLCQAIREDSKGFGAICAPAGQMFTHLMQNKEAFSEECDGGMMRISVPIVKDGELLGAVGGCGLFADDGEVDEFSIDMMSDLDAGHIAEMAQSVKKASPERVKEIQSFIQERITEALNE